MYMCICTHTYIHVYTHTHIHTPIFIDILGNITPKFISMSGSGSFSSLQRVLCYLKASDLFQVYLVYLVTLLNFDWMQFFTPRIIHFNWLRKNCHAMSTSKLCQYRIEF